MTCTTSSSLYNISATFIKITKSKFRYNCDETVISTYYVAALTYCHIIHLYFIRKIMTRIDVQMCPCTKIRRLQATTVKLNENTYTLSYYGTVVDEKNIFMPTKSEIQAPVII